MNRLDHKFVWRMSHDFKSENPDRKTCYTRANEFFSKEGVFKLDTKQYFARNKRELDKLFELLPSEFENLERIHSQEWKICTRERISNVFNYWQNTYQVNKSAQDLYGSLEREISRFALHLQVFIDFEAFLNSQAEILIFLEDDIFVEDDFLTETEKIVSQLPPNWDCFNYIVSSEFENNFQSYLQYKETDYSINYQLWPGSCLLVSKSGARKYLYEMIFNEVDSKVGDPNKVMSFDCKLSNQKLHEPFDDNIFHFSIDYSISRKFLTYTYVPGRAAPISLLQTKSTWRI